MQPEVGLSIILAAAIISVAYASVLIKLNVIGTPKKRPIRGPAEYVQFNLLRSGTNYSKIISGVLHHRLFHRSDYVNLLRSLDFPIFIIFGPRLCWETYLFLKVFREKDNLRLYQFLGTKIEGLTPDEEMRISRKRIPHCLIVDGIHCFVEMPHPEHEFPKGGWEFENNISVTSEYEDKFDFLISYCKEVDRKHIMRSISIDNIYITVDGKYQPVIALDDAHKRLSKFAKEIGEGEEFEELWNKFSESQIIN